MAYKKTPPKFSIANGFVIGSFLQEIKFFNKEGQRVTRKVEDDGITDRLKAMLAPLRQYGFLQSIYQNLIQQYDRIAPLWQPLHAQS